VDEPTIQPIPEVLEPPPKRPLARPWPRISPAKLIFPAVAIVVVAAGWWQVRERSLNRLREQLVPEARRGLVELRDGEFEAAYQHLKFAVDALDRLGERFPNDNRYRQAFRELDIVVNLIELPLEDSLSGPTISPQVLSDSLHHRSIILDAEVEPGAAAGWNVGYVTVLNDQIVPIHTDGLTLFSDANIVARTRVIFGARIDGLKEAGGGQWTIRLVPDSGVMITEPMIYGRLGLANDQESERVRQRQRDQIAQRLEISFDGDDDVR
jgi:hypothetical protein